MKSVEKVAVSETQGENIPKIYREISPIKSKKRKIRKMIAKSISECKNEESGEKMAVSEVPTTGEVPQISPTTGEVPKIDCTPIKNLDLSEEKLDTIDGKIGEK